MSTKDLFENPPAYAETDPYLLYLTTLGDKTVYVKSYIGNSGDSLIHLGTVELLSALGIQQTLNPLHADVILWPGGNPTMWETNIATWKECWTQWPDKEFVVGPATFQGGSFGWRELIKDTPQLAAAFARDPASYQNLKSATSGSTKSIGLSHDPAFYLMKADWLHDHRVSATEEYTLICLRNDHESYTEPPLFTKLIPRPFNEPFDRKFLRRARQATARSIAQQHPDAPTQTHDASLYDFQSFLELVRRAKRVHTNRLHCMILATLLDKEVHIHQTGYSKLEAVYQHSIRDWHKATITQNQKP
ncbi:polysaccharide pyruvyl transferase family protein [Pelagicoccus mobilis]|uniref:Polysaccharide pyruvyl transferase family protein n=1 Tax=Pelagicoccus mobilis TaxID=415221 RepID=A0A934VQM0_9BACT|nr:polysaccharide pyruvyl transferase family protein [Pelagicoccus mobilis]MBK1876634.1 polysaccharide pyruvyl transferase family protein [Pelagicoccus mobilis]